MAAGVQETELPGVSLGDIAGQVSFAQLEYVNSMPLWLGGHEGRTILCLDDQCRNWRAVELTGHTIEGKMRWLARLVVASFLDDETLNREGYRATERESLLPNIAPLEELFGTTNGAGKFSVLVETLTRPTHEEPEGVYEPETGDLARRLQQYIREAERRVQQRGRQLRLSDVLALMASRGLERIDRRGSCESGVECFLTIPRVQMSFLGEDLRELARELFTRQPISAGFYRVRVTLLPRPGALLTSEERVFLTLLLHAALAVLGVGKASARGLGRFALTRVGFLSEDVERSVGNLRALGPMELVRRLLDLGGSPRLKDSLVLVPRLSYARNRSRVLNSIRHPCVDNGRRRCTSSRTTMREPTAVASALGFSVLKITWKYRFPPTQGVRGVQFTGAPYHTWVLGLPRRTNQYGYAYGVPRGFTRSLNLRDYDEGRRLSTVFTVPLLSPNNPTTVGGVVLMPLAVSRDFETRERRTLVHLGFHRHSRVSHAISVSDLINAPNLDEASFRGPASAFPGVMTPQGALREGGGWPGVNDAVGDFVEIAMDFMESLLT